MRVETNETGAPGSGAERPPTVNYVIGSDLRSKIFSDIFRRFMEISGAPILISEDPLPGADVYHYHRPQLAETLAPNSVVTVHHDLDDDDPFVRFERFEPVYRQARAIICLNGDQRDWLAARGLERTVVIPHGYDSGLFAKRAVRAFPAERKIRLGILSKFYGRRFKGEAYLFRLLDDLDRDRFSFLLVGAARAETAQAMRELGFEVECHEYVPYRVYPSIYEAIDLLLITSAYEGGPANLPEAVGSGTPVVCTRVGMAGDMIEDGVNGVFLSKDPAVDGALFDALAGNDGGLFDRLQAGANRLTTAPTWEANVAAHMELYRTVAAG